MTHLKHLGALLLMAALIACEAAVAPTGDQPELSVTEASSGNRAAAHESSPFLTQRAQCDDTTWYVFNDGVERDDPGGYDHPIKRQWLQAPENGRWINSGPQNQTVKRAPAGLAVCLHLRVRGGQYVYLSWPVGDFSSRSILTSSGGRLPLRNHGYNGAIPSGVTDLLLRGTTKTVEQFWHRYLTVSVFGACGRYGGINYRCDSLREATPDPVYVAWRNNPPYHELSGADAPSWVDRIVVINKEDDQRIKFMGVTAASIPDPVMVAHLSLPKSRLTGTGANRMVNDLTAAEFNMIGIPGVTAWGDRPEVVEEPEPQVDPVDPPVDPVVPETPALLLGEGGEVINGNPRVVTWGTTTGANLNTAYDVTLQANAGETTDALWVEWRFEVNVPSSQRCVLSVDPADNPGSPSGWVTQSGNVSVPAGSVRWATNSGVEPVIGWPASTTDQVRTATFDGVGDEKLRFGSENGPTIRIGVTVTCS